jgi:hypothetical protein
MSKFRYIHCNIVNAGDGKSTSQRWGGKPQETPAVCALNKIENRVSIKGDREMNEIRAPCTEQVGSVGGRSEYSTVLWCRKSVKVFE